MSRLDAHLTARALRSVGDVLSARGVSHRVRLVLAGGTAGLFGGFFREHRVTGDCDVLWSGDDQTWRAIADAARSVAEAQGLPPTWLNRDCTAYAWCLPLGWQQRCEPVGAFGPLEVLRIGRFDLIAAKVMGAPGRPQDLEDLFDLRPTSDEIRLLDEHLDRLEAEDLDRRTFDHQRRIVDALRGIS